jgi:hypothetical protein
LGLRDGREYVPPISARHESILESGIAVGKI